MRKIISKTIARIVNYRLIKYSLVGGVFRNIFDERTQMLDTAMKYASVSKLEGGYFEFGCYVGKTMISAYHTSRQYLPDINFYGFDSFCGLPSEKNMDINDSFKPFKEGQFSCSEAQFKNNLKKSKVDISRINTISGWYKDTLTKETRKKINTKKVAIVYVDCDLYESTVLVLNFILPYLQDGTLILFDDWFTYRGNPKRGEQKAFKEWLISNKNLSASQYHTFAWSGNSFIVHLD